MTVDVIEMDRMEYLLKVLNLFMEQNDVETLIRWQSFVDLPLIPENRLGFGLKNYLRNRPEPYLHIPGIRIERDMQNTKTDIAWEDLIQVHRGEESLFELIETNIANGEYA